MPPRSLARLDSATAADELLAKHAPQLLVGRSAPPCASAARPQFVSPRRGPRAPKVLHELRSDTPRLVRRRPRARAAEIPSHSSQHGYGCSWRADRGEVAMATPPAQTRGIYSCVHITRPNMRAHDHARIRRSCHNRDLAHMHPRTSVRVPAHKRLLPHVRTRPCSPARAHQPRSFMLPPRGKDARAPTPTRTATRHRSPTRRYAPRRRRASAAAFS